MNVLLAVFIGGGLGSLARFGVSSVVTSGFKNINPVGTLTANILSTILLGVVLYLASQKLDISDNMKLFLITGFCGGFSTFSTFSYETFELFRTGQLWFAAANILISVALGVGVLFAMSKSI